jgi:hypothetical protein
MHQERNPGSGVSRDKESTPEPGPRTKKSGVATLLVVAFLCSPVILHVRFAIASRDTSSSAWFFIGLVDLVLLGALPLALIVATVSSIRRRVNPVLIWTMWAILVLTFMLLRAFKGVSPWV